MEFVPIIYTLLLLTVIMVNFCQSYEDMIKVFYKGKYDILVRVNIGKLLLSAGNSNNLYMNN
jgi:hypothetical protein